MNRPPQGRGPPRAGATWYPGGQDDFYMPEVISPSPQRVMPEVPENMQDNIAQMEHHARDPRRAQQQQYHQQQPSSLGSSPAPAPAQYRQQFPERTSSAVQGQPQQAQVYDHGAYAQSATYDTMDHPNFSPSLFSGIRPRMFPQPMSSERPPWSVIVRLAWAQDTLTFVEVAAQNEDRLSLTQPPRPHTPPVERQLRTDAMNIVSFLAEQHHPHAEFIKGMWLEFGKFGFRVDRKEAFRCYSRAAEKGYARAEYRIGMQFESSGEPEKAIRHYERGVAMSDSASYYRLGMMILLGQHGQRQDYQRGLEYIRLAAQSCDQNAPQGAYVYGMLCARELPQVSVPDAYLPADLNTARVNIEKAAFNGFAKAQVKMGAAYELCQLGCDFNPALSLHYNALAARQGEPEAEMAISKWFLCGHEGVFEKNDELAFTYAQRAAQSGLPTAEFALGYFYEVGIFVPVDIKEARSWYAKAAASGNKDASGRIDSISRSKTLSRKDHEKVAISRIKSTRYVAHQRGGSLEATPENIEMPDPSRMTLSDQPSAAAPYPDRPISRPRPRVNLITKCRILDQARLSVSNGPSQGYGGPPGSNPGSRSASYGQGPMNYRPGPGTPMSAPAGPTSPQAGNMISPSGTPRVDVGYSAPIPPPGGDRRRPNRLEGVPPDRKPVRTPVSAQGGPGPLPSPRLPASPRSTGSPSSGQFPPGQFPRVENHPQSATPTQKPSTQPSKPSGQLPGKGPKTFEEMGVPSANKDSDCATDICLNLHNKVSKGRYEPPACSHGISCAKISKGKQPRSCKSYIRMGRLQGRSQQVSDDNHTNEIDTMTTEIKHLQNELSSIKAEEKTARSSLSTLKAIPRIPELRLDIQRLEKEQIDLQTQLTGFTGLDPIKLSPEERSTLESEWKYWQRQATLRRRICRDLWGLCSEVLPENITASELWMRSGMEARNSWGMREKRRDRRWIHLYRSISDVRLVWAPLKTSGIILRVSAGRAHCITVEKDPKLMLTG
ncbi:Chitin synthase activator (Chs3) [Penicillium hetheringtonii]|uniref:Chitin synthase activator (Chs3) n=1 Tax=Penicillium hetheringtonii TaxID=911720 RepID=A0AAD6GPS6_9EURO|nr:Chitin synthase activator (Chs3) [Penicillium hetheringtonii]